MDDREVPPAVAAAVARGLGGRLSEVVPTGDGHLRSWYGAVDGTAIVVKVSPVASFEAWALTAARAHGAPVPEVLAVEAGDASPFGEPYLITRRVPGTALPSGRQRSTRLLRRAGGALRAIHEVVGTGFGVPDGSALRDGTVRGAAASWPAAIADWVELFVSRLGPRLDGAVADAVWRAVDEHAGVLAGCVRSTLVHGDFTPRHIVVSGWPRRVGGVVDFGGGQFGAPAYDLAVFSLAAPHVVALAEGYEADGAARRSLLEEVPFYRMMRALAETTWADMAGVDLTRTMRQLRLHLRALGQDVTEPS